MEAEREEGEKPKMAESETQTKLKEAEVTEHDSFLMVNMDSVFRHCDTLI